MESKKLRRRGSTTTGGELIHVHGFAYPKSQLYQFSSSTGDFCYGVGSNIIVYDPVNHIQKEFLK